MSVVSKIFSRTADELWPCAWSQSKVQSVRVQQGGRSNHADEQRSCGVEVVSFGRWGGSMYRDIIGDTRFSPRSVQALA